MKRTYLTSVAGIKQTPPPSPNVKQPHRSASRGIGGPQGDRPLTNSRRVAREIELGAYGKVLSGDHNNALRVGTFNDLKHGARHQYRSPLPCRLCHAPGTSPRGFCFRCELECQSFLHLLK